MHDPLLLLYPVINAIVTTLFAGVVLLQYIQHRRLSQLYWAIALLMAALGTLAYVGMIVAQPTSDIGTALFRIYYILGAALMPAWLGLGSLALVASKRVIRLSFTLLCILSYAASILISMASINMSKLAGIAGTPGVGVLVAGAWRPTIIVLNTLGVIAVVGVALYSGWKVWKKQHTSRLLWANLCILSGDLMNAAAGSLAGLLGIQHTFWFIMALGWIVFFYGVLLASRRSVPAQSRSQERPTGEANRGTVLP